MKPSPEPRSWVVEFPAGMELLTSNSRLSRYPRAALTHQLRDTGITMARKLRLPRLEQATVLAVYHPPAHRHPFASAMVRDVGSLAPTVKALIDGITQAGVFPQDSAKHVMRESYEFGPKSERGQVVLHITELPAPAAPATQHSGSGRHRGERAGFFRRTDGGVHA